MLSVLQLQDLSLKKNKKTTAHLLQWFWRMPQHRFAAKLHKCFEKLHPAFPPAYARADSDRIFTPGWAWPLICFRISLDGTTFYSNTFHALDKRRDRADFKSLVSSTAGATWPHASPLLRRRAFQRRWCQRTPAPRLNCHRRSSIAVTCSTKSTSEYREAF